MAYIGFNPSQLAVAPFATKLFTGDGTTTTFTLDQSVPGANEANVEVVVENVIQNPIDAYTISGALNNQLVFSEAPVAGAAIYVIHKGEATYNLQPSTGSVTAATLDPVLRNFTVNTFTGTGSQTQFTLTDTPYSPNSILVMVDGIVQTASVNYTVSGTTLDFGATAPDNGSTITVVHLGFSSGNKAVMDRSITPLKLSTGAPTWDTSSVLYIGTGTALGGATNPIVAMNSTANNYVQSYVRNTSTGTGASADLVAYPDNGTDATGWIDMGITSSTFSSTPFGITGPNEGYLFMSAPAGASKTGNMVLATDSTGTSNAIVFATGGFTTGTERMRIYAPPDSVTTAKVTIGTLSGVSPTTTLNVYGKTNDHGMYSQTRVTTGGTSVGVGQEMFLRFVDSAGTPFIAGSIYAEARNGAASGGTVIPAGQGDGALEIKAWTAGSVSNKLRLEPTGAINIPYGQIKFPAAQNASSDPNTLDDYEEGTWSPVFGGGSAQTNAGWYVKVGRLVTLGLDNCYASAALATGAQITITGMPFTVSGTNFGGGAASVAVTTISSGYKEYQMSSRLYASTAWTVTNTSGVAITTSDIWNLGTTYYTSS